MNNEMIKRLNDHFATFAHRGQELTDRFYANLFSQNPQVRSMFPQDMTDQKKKLLSSLVLVMNNLTSPDKLVEPLKEMGKRHVSYGTEADHYPVVRDTMVQTIGDISGESWTPQLKQDWTDALNVVAEIMLQGANELQSASV